MKYNVCAQNHKKFHKKTSLNALNEQATEDKTNPASGDEVQHAQRYRRMKMNCSDLVLVLVLVVIWYNVCEMAHTTDKTS